MRDHVDNVANNQRLENGNSHGRHNPYHRPVVAAINGGDTDCHRSDDQINIVIESSPGCNLGPVKRKFIRCSVNTTVTHIKKFVAVKLFSNPDQYKDIDILCNGQLLGKDHMLRFVQITQWLTKEPPLKLQYRPRTEL